MKKLVMALTLATLGSAAIAAPLNFDFSQSYVAAMGSYQHLSKVRYGNVNAYGAQFSYGLPITEVLNLEATAFATYMPRPDNSADLSHGLGLDLLVMQRNDKYASFLLAGAGALREDIGHVESIAPYVNVGAGLIGNIPFLSGFSYRAELRGVVDINKDGAPGRGKSVFIEPRINVGLQYGFGFAEAKPAEPVLPVDSDADGVMDPSDLCPNTPPGTAVDATGCPAAPVDTDADGVLDPIDQCPNTPAGTVVDATGCAPPVPGVAPDLDGDGVLNELDKCPGTPPSFKVDVVGCMVEQTVALQNVNFEFGSDQLTAGAKGILDTIAGSLLAQTAVKVLVTGHTDALGPQSFNLQLSQRRAKTVMQYLSEKGVEAARLTAEGEGEFSPIASNDKEEGRAQNRRVEFKITAQ